MKRFLTWAVVGAAVGDLVGVLMGGKLISYWVRPPGITDQDRCVVEVDAALAELVKLQGITAAIGLVVFLIIGFIWSRRRSSTTSAPEALK